MLRTILRTLYGLYAAIAFVVVVLIVFCPILIVAPSLRLRRAVGRLTVRAWLFVIFVPFRVKGLHNLPEGPCVVVCNHASYVDGIVLTAALPDHFTFLVQHQARDWPYVGLIIRRMGCAFVNRGAVIPAGLSVRRLINDVEAGASVAIFPEGSFRREPGLMPFYGGAFTIAARTGIPVVVVVMRGSRQLFSDGEILPRPSALEIEIFKRISPTGSRRADATQLLNAARKMMLVNYGEASVEYSAEEQVFRAPPGAHTPGCSEYGDAVSRG